MSAGAKASWDLPRTLEYLKPSQFLLLAGKPISFRPYTRDSGLPVPHRVEDAESAAQIHLARRELGQGGTLLVAPIPAADELDPTESTGSSKKV